MKRIFAVILLILLLWVIAALSSCYTQKQAEHQTNKALLNYPDVVAHIARDHFPCIVTHNDTTTVTDTLMEFIECPEQSEYTGRLDIIKDTVHHTIKVPVKVPAITRTITVTIEDSAKIRELSSQLLECSDEVVKDNDKIERLGAKIAAKNKELWIYRGLWFLILLYGIYRGYRSITTVRVKT